MKPYLIIILLAAFGFLGVQAQDFGNKYSIALPDSLTYEDIAWVDFNNDTLLDVLVKTGNSNHESIFLIFKNNSDHQPQFQSAIITGFRDVTYLITDFDSDNKMDIVLSGNKSGVLQTVMLRNNANFDFTEQPVTTLSGTTIRLADLNADGKRELLLSGINGEEEYLYVLKGEDSHWQTFDTLNIHATSVEVWDFNKDQFADMFISGYDSMGLPTSRLYSSNGAYSLEKELISDVAGKTSVSDMDHDGILDVVIAGVDKNLNPVTEIYFLNDNSFSKKSIEAFRTHSLFTGDVDKDGKCDLNLLEETAGSDTLNLILRGNDFDTLAIDNVVQQAFGDFDRDGDLDIAQVVIRDNERVLVIAENKTPGTNKGPAWGGLIAAGKVFNYLMLRWLPATDDHTISSAITYDVSLSIANEILEPGSFDNVNRKRLVVAHGNVGTDLNAMIKVPDDSEIDFAIQAIDNAYHTSNQICKGGGGDFCTTVNYKKVGVCHDETKTLKAPHGNGLWMSFSKGVLVESPELTVTVDKEDTLAVISPSEESACAFVDVFILHFRDTAEHVKSNAIYICANSTVSFETTPRWEQVLWSSQLQGELSKELTVSYTTTENDSVFLYETDGKGCERYETTPVVISKPQLGVEDENLQIMRGEGVQLHASGAESYQWAPAESLNDPNSPDPFAKPWQTTQYIVTGFDSLHCDSSVAVLVIVEEAAFLPTLFTPNDDGSNDALRAFGLDDVKNFRFTIYNREGSQVYSTTSTAELGTSGWDGTFKGSKQPAGVYYWKVEGENNIGRNLLLNGKNVGSVVLIR